MYKATPNGTVELTQDELDHLNSLPAFFEQKLAERNRNERNTILSQSDWTQIADSALTDEAKALWVTYRTALRDLTAHANWPNLEDADWPTKP